MGIPLGDNVSGDDYLESRDQLRRLYPGPERCGLSVKLSVCVNCPAMWMACGPDLLLFGITDRTG